MTTIAFLGTGLLGAAFAQAAAKRGDSVTVWNRSADKARALEAFGVTVAATPADAAPEPPSAPGGARAGGARAEERSRSSRTLKPCTPPPAMCVVLSTPFFLEEAPPL